MTDHTLLHQWTVERDAEAFRQIAARYAGMVYATCMRVLGNANDAEDVSQECFETLARLDKGPTGHLGAWLHKVAVNRAIDRVRADRRRKVRETQFVAERETAIEPDWDDIYGHVDEAIADLPDKFRAAVVAHFLENQSHADVAQATDISPRTVAYRVKRGVELICKSLKRRGVSVTGTVLVSMLGANLAEAAALPASFTAALGKLALACTADKTIGGALSIGTGVKLFGGLLVMKKAILTVAVVVAVMGIWMLSQNEPPESVVPDEPDRKVAVPGPVVSMLEAEVEDDLAEPETVPEEPGSTEAADVPEGGVITGRVYDEETGAGIAEAVILAGMEDGDEDGELQAATDSSGRYRFENLDAGQYEVGREEMPEGYREPTWFDEPVPVLLANGQVVGGVDFAVSKEALLAGIVVDYEKSPIAGATVRLAGGKDIYVSTDTASDEDGRFAIHGLTPTEDLYIAARKDNLVSHAQKFKLPINGRTDIVVTLMRGAKISGRVVDQQDRPLPDIQVIREQIPSSRVGTKGGSSVTDDRGQFELGPLAAGSYRLLTIPPDTIPHIGQDEGTRITVAEAEHVQDIVLVYDRVHTISGRVVDEDGRPLTGATVDGGRAGKAQTDRNGQYELAEIGPGNYDLDVRLGSYRTAQRQGVVAGSEGVDFMLVRDLTQISGRVLNADTDEPITDFNLDWYAFDHLWWPNGKPQLTSRRPPPRYTSIHNAEGRFEVPVTLNTSWTRTIVVVAVASGFSTDLEVVDLDSARADEQIVFHLQPGATLSGIVTDSAGNPVANASVFYGGFASNTTGRTVATTRADGTFSIDSFPHGFQRIAVHHPGYAVSTIGVIETWDRSQPVEVVLRAGGTLEGNVLGAGTERMSVGISYPDQPRGMGQSVSPDADGTFRIEHVLPGNATARLQIDYGGGLYRRRLLQRPLVIEEGMVTTVDFDVLEGHNAIEGNVDVGGLDIERILVVARIATPDGEEMHIVLGQTDGSYLLEGLPAGATAIEVTATAQSGEELSTTVELDLTDGENVRQDIDLTY